MIRPSSFDEAPGESHISQTLTLTPGRTYRLSVWYRTGAEAVTMDTRFLVYAPQLGNYLAGLAVSRSGTFG